MANIGWVVRSCGDRPGDRRRDHSSEEETGQEACERQRDPGQSAPKTGGREGDEEDDDDDVEDVHWVKSLRWAAVAGSRPR